MRVHANQINQNAALDALYSAQRASAKREAARTRKKLSEFASELAGEASREGYVAGLEEREGREGQERQQDQQNDDAVR